VACLVLVTTRSVIGQEPAGPSCDSALRAAHVDSVNVTARAYLVRRDEGVLPARARALVLEGILAAFAPPKPLALPVFGPGPMRTRMLRRDSPDTLTTRAPLLYGVYDFWLRRDGSFSRVKASVPSLANGFDEAVAAAVSAAASDSVLALVPRALDVDSIDLELRITTGPEDPRLRVPAVTMFTAAFPVVRMVDAKPTGAIPLAPYPEDEADEGRDGEVVLRVIVDTKGAAMIPTIEVQHATSPAFALAAARALARYQFTPAHVGGCPVPQVVEVPFWFSLRP
jgi:hypothetical protein